MPSNAVNWDNCLDQAALSDVGLRRTSNQDSYAVNLASTQELWQRRGHLFIVADGMGAHAAGEYASKLAVDNIPHTYNKHADEPPADALRTAIEEANRVIYTRGQANLEFQGMGTTCSALLLTPDGAIISHVGDSRVYRLRGNRLDQLTFDHSLVWELKASGQLGKEDVPSYIPKNIITRSLGPNAEVRVDIEGPHPVAVGDTFLLCSDGLSGQITNEEMAAILGALPPQDAVHALVDLANLRGGPDNITVIVVKVTGPQIARMGGSSNGQSSTVSSGPRNKIGVIALFGWLLAGLLGAAGIGFFLWEKPILAGLFLFFAVATVLTVVLGQSRTNRPRATVKHTGNHGGGPYATAVFTANADFVNELSRVLDQLRDAANHEDWVVDWSKVISATDKAVAATRAKDYIVAVREYCRAISQLMGELRSQHRTK